MAMVTRDALLSSSLSTHDTPLPPLYHPHRAKQQELTMIGIIVILVLLILLILYNKLFG